MVGRQQRDMERRYSIAEVPSELSGMPPPGLMPSASEDLHAWSIYRQNLNSDFTDSALGSSEKSPLPYGNFQLRESTVQSILSHPRYGPKSALGSNMYTYLKFGLPRVFPPNGGRGLGGGGRDGSSGYDSSDDGNGNGTATARSRQTRARHASQQHLQHQPGAGYYLRARSDPDFRNTPYHGPSMALRQQLPVSGPPPPRGGGGGGRGKSVSEANLLAPEVMLRHSSTHPYEHRRSVHDLRGAAIAYSELGPAPHVLVHPARRQLIYSQPTSLTNWLTHVLLAAILSLIVGAIFWDVPKSDPQLLYADRIGFHYTMMCVASLPILLMLTLSDARSTERAASQMDIRDGLYSRLIFIIITALISFPAVLFVWLAYIIPAYAMTALYNQGSQTPNGFHIYINFPLSPYGSHPLRPCSVGVLSGIGLPHLPA
ncbi:hypothetical protein LSTR_LSTR013335 [Laodelphax striatellus]|uniref:ABC-2 type transporter transmembrane domain-containing protein n=1 Tax=Laodelphax striatellus TaxID=195883 RepID=A0A482WP25_LAOST|nr:hypothetical protein LSTR_LSTR013335 [Laodelphax striatellus]